MSRLQQCRSIWIWVWSFHRNPLAYHRPNRLSSSTNHKKVPKVDVHTLDERCFGYMSCRVVSCAQPNYKSNGSLTLLPDYNHFFHLKCIALALHMSYNKKIKSFLDLQKKQWSPKPFIFHKYGIINSIWYNMLAVKDYFFHQQLIRIKYFGIKHWSTRYYLFFVHVFCFFLWPWIFYRFKLFFLLNGRRNYLRGYRQWQQ